MTRILFVLSCLSLFLFLGTTEAQRPRDYSYADSYQREDSVRSSPKQGWSGDFTLVDAKNSDRHSFWLDILLWAPNRVLDFVDIFRVDVGVGPSVGAVVRATEYGQFGARFMMPTSVRFGLFGRQSPLLVETAGEYGVGPAYVRSKQRNSCKGQVGLGLDLLVAGLNAGICLEEIADFVAGVFFFDIMNDDEK